VRSAHFYHILPRQIVKASFALALLPHPRQFVAYYCGAGDGTRTRDNLLGRQGLYRTELLPQNNTILTLKNKLCKGGVPSLLKTAYTKQ
jgi:hypothetical protein